MVSCAVYSCKRRSEKSNYSKDGISYHTFPKHPAQRKAWLDFCRRPLTWVPRRTSCICSDHFEPSCFQVGSRRQMNDGAIPTLFSCDCSVCSCCKKNCAATHGTFFSAHDTESSAASPPLYEHAPSDDSESQVPEIPVTVKIEVDEEDISEHEEDIMEKLENRKRMQENDPIAVDAKKVRVELLPVPESQPQQPPYKVIVQPQQSQVQSQSQYVGVLQNPLQHKCAAHATQSQAQEQPDTSEPMVVPEFFMNVVVRNQNEILSILKRQVLLQDPDPELLTFLRFLGSKLLRYPKKKRDELQDRITEMLLLE